jgi:hypothetical protein
LVKGRAAQLLCHTNRHTDLSSFATAARPYRQPASANAERWH